MSTKAQGVALAGSGTAWPDPSDGLNANIFSRISGLLVNEILHLRETLQFYELELFEPAPVAGGHEAGQLPCGSANCCGGQAHFEF